MKPSIRRVQDALQAAGLDAEVMELPASTRTAKEAAEAIGCEVSEIAKSIVFRGSESGDAIVVIACGSNRISEARVAAELGEALEKASAEFVRAKTGFAIGGVPPCAHASRSKVFLDRELLQLARIWAAAGTPHAVFPLTPAQLLRLTGGRIMDIKQDS